MTSDSEPHRIGHTKIEQACEQHITRSQRNCGYTTGRTKT